MKKKGIIIEVFPKSRPTSLLRKGIVRLDSGKILEFSGVFSKSEEKKLMLGSRIRGFLDSDKILRNTEFHGK